MTTRRQLGRLAARAAAVGVAAFSLNPVELVAAKSETALRVVVVDEQGEPVSRASVIVSRVKSVKGDKVKIKGAPMQIKTSMQGSAPLPPLPQGQYLVQVISSGFQTYDDLIELTETEQTVSVTLSPPQKQFSVHKKP